MMKSIYELEVHQIELKLQNEELRLAKTAAYDIALKYTTLYDLAPIGYYTLSSEGTIIEVNLCGAKMFGKERPVLINSRFGFFVSDNTRQIFNLFLYQVFSSKVSETCEVTVQITGNLPMYVVLTGIVTENGENCIVTIVDISDSKIMKALQQSEQLYLAVVEWSPYAVIIHRDMKIIYANPAAVIMFGATSSHDLLETNILDRLHPDFHKIVLERIRKGIDSGINAPLIELRYFKLDGTIIDAEVQSLPIVYGGVPCIQVAMRDITERKLIEDQLRENNSKLDHALQMANMAWWEMDIPTGHVIFDKRKAEMLGYAPENFKYYIDFTNLIHPEDHDMAMHAMQGYLTGLFEKYEVEYRIQTKSGEYKWFYDNGSIVKKNANGKPLNLSGFVIDITTRKHAEEELRQSHARYTSMTSNITDVIGIMGADGIMTYKSPNIEKWFGWLPQDRVGTSGFSTIHPDDLEYVGKVFYSLLEKDNSVITLEFRYQCKDGSYKPIELTAANLLNDPFIHGVLLNYRDITERRQKEATNCKRSFRLSR